MLHALVHPWLSQKRVSLSVWREDLNHAVISGNKWHKLQPWLQAAEKQHCNHLMSFGGRHSNHLHALAYACQQRGWRSTGWVRGHARQGMTATLADCLRWGMRVHFVSRHQYKQRYAPQWSINAQVCWPDAMIIPEGGTGELGVSGVRAWGEQLAMQLPDASRVLVPVGSGGTLAGLVMALAPQHPIVAVPVVKPFDTLLNELTAAYHLPAFDVWPGAGRGFGRHTDEEIAFDEFFTRQFGVVLDPVYTLKVAWQFWQRLLADELEPGSSWVLIHTGGIQGRRDWETGVKRVQCRQTP